MAGLLIKELLMRGDVHRCLICVPGSLSDQWQDELWFKFQLQFEILSREMVENTVSGNPFAEKDLLIIRLDQVARSEELQAKLQRSDWDMVIVDEAHKMSASYWGGELKQTKRYKLGQLLGNITRHLLLMTATPHNGKEEDFQQFLALLDNDRFEGRFRGHETHQVDVSDIMRRMVKENLLKFDGRPLFPERRAYTAEYNLSNVEMELYHAVSEYVREGFDRAERQLDGQRRGTVGFALTVLQRRLASSPEAIYQSLIRRRERLIKRLKEIEQQQHQLPDRQHLAGTILDHRHLAGTTGDFILSADDLEDMEDLPAEELEEFEETILDSATAALTIQELREEIETLRQLEQQAHKVRYGPHDRKWQQLATLLQDDTHMVDSDGHRRKIVIFTEHRDTLNYLHENIATLFGQEDTIVRIEGRMRRAE
ncbi:MAG: DEAD/DEAH box helicase family protein, partial [Anaerolineales bacterium]|nr:DEAD/DEAH box helicase family protein [Anaerolineales bacterium]